MNEEYMAIQSSFIINSAVFSFLGIGIFIVGFIVLDLLTPYKLWKEICEKNNIALAILVGCCALGLSIIIASAIH